MSSLYIHFPYCLYKCHYCDFNSYQTAPDAIPYAGYVDALIRELSLRVRLSESDHPVAIQPGTPIETIFFGGGTPSLMEPAHVGKILDAVRSCYPLAPDAEVTLEANPKTLNGDKLKGFKEAGINRLSMGVQSLNDKYLAAFGRIHTAEEAREAIRMVADAGFKSWNFDLIFGFPGQTFAEWEETLKEAVTFSPPHLSCYSFMVEKEAPYGRWAAEGKVALPDGDVQADMMAMTRDFLREKGWGAYEVSNFCRPGHESRHNLAYWKYGEYLGLGAGAVSMFQCHPGSEEVFRVRTTNLKSPSAYLKAVSDGAGFFQTEDVSLKNAMDEFMMMGLRLKDGIDPCRFQEVTGLVPEDVYREGFLSLRQKGWLKENPIALTEEGVLFLDSLLVDLLS